MTPMILLCCFLAGSLPPLALVYLRERMHAEKEAQWMRIFSVKSLEIPGTSMDASQLKEEVKTPKVDNRKRVRTYLPVSDFAIQAYAKMKRN